MRALTLLAVGMALLLPGPTFAQGWIKYVDQAERFIVNFPGEPAVQDISYTSAYGAEFPARVYTAEEPPGRYSVTVVNFNDAERVHRELAERTGGRFSSDFAIGDVLGSVAYAAWNIRQRSGEITYDAWAAIDRIAGHQLQITNADQSRTFAGIYLHASRLYILEATVPLDWPAPGHFQQSLGILDEEGRRVRYILDTDGNRTRVDTSYEWIGVEDPVTGEPRPE